MIQKEVLSIKIHEYQPPTQTNILPLSTQTPRFHEHQVSWMDNPARY